MARCAPIDELGRRTTKPARGSARYLGTVAAATLVLVAGVLGAPLTLRGETAAGGRARRRGFWPRRRFKAILLAAAGCYAGKHVRQAASSGETCTALARTGGVMVSRDTSRNSQPRNAPPRPWNRSRKTLPIALPPPGSAGSFRITGAWLFRTVNTLDSRWGYRGRTNGSARTAAVADDVLAAVPARVSAILLIAAAPLARSSSVGAVRSSNLAIADERRVPMQAGQWRRWRGRCDAGSKRRRLTCSTLTAATAAPGDIARAQRLVSSSAVLLLLACDSSTALAEVRQFSGDRNGYE